MKDALSPAIGEPGDGRRIIDDARRKNEPSPPKLLGARPNEKAVRCRGDAGSKAVTPRYGGVDEYILPACGRYEFRRPAVISQESVRMACEAISPLARIENEHLSTSANQLQRRGKASVASPNDDCVVHKRSPRISGPAARADPQPPPVGHSAAA